jgi:predicted transcriptional regulator YdeE
MIPRALLIAAASGVLAAISFAQNPQSEGKAMDLVKTALTEPISVAGYQIRTSNAREMTGQGEIGTLWGRFMQENLAAQIPHRIGQTLIVVYSGYASDENGEYNYLLGAPVSSIEGLPTGLTSVQIAPGNYAVIITEKGDVTQVIPAAWKRIWAMTPQELGGRRAFTTDYEIYDQRSADPKNARVEIHLAITNR